MRSGSAPRSVLVIAARRGARPASTRTSTSPRYVVLQYVVLATAWNILGGYAGYVNFGTAGLLRARRVHRGGPLQVGSARRSPVLIAGRRRWSAALLGFGVGMLTLRLRGIFFSIATVALVFIMETMIINWGYVGGATGLQLLRPDVLAPFGSYTRLLFVVMALLAVVAVAVARYIETLLDRPRPARDARQRGGRRVHRGCRRSAQALRLHGLGRADGRGRRAVADVPHASSSRLRPSTSTTRSTRSPCR